MGLAEFLFSLDWQSGTLPDTNHVGIVDLWVVSNGLNLRLNDANQVYNAEGVTNLEAYNSGLSPWLLENVGT